MFEGLCIGGPFAGRRVTSAMPVLFAPKMEAAPAPPVPADDVPDTAPTGEHMRYVWSELHVSTASRYGFWVPEGETGNYLINELCAAYETVYGKVH